MTNTKEGVTTIQDIIQVGVGVPDRERFENFARDLLGFSTSRSPDEKVTYLRPNQYPHRIAAYTTATCYVRSGVAR